jgi:hypothetical protein
MKIFAIFVATAAFLSTLSPLASANSDEPTSGFPAAPQTQYLPNSNNLTSNNSDYPCNSKFCATASGRIIQNGNSSPTAGVSFGITFTSGTSDLIRAETERTLADLQYTSALLEKFSNAITSKNTELTNAYAILLAPKLGFKNSKELMENMGTRR